MTLKAIANKIEQSTGEKYVICAATAGAFFAEFSAEDWPGYSAICKKAWSMNGVHVENHLNTKTVRVWTAEDWTKFSAFENEKKHLVDGFWEALHNRGREAADAYFLAHEAEYDRLGI